MLVYAAVIPLLALSCSSREVEIEAPESPEATTTDTVEVPATDDTEIETPSGTEIEIDD
jgi:hypothetical protein